VTKKLPKLNLPSADALFTTQTERDDSQREKVLDIPLSEIDSFPEHPFLVKMDESMQTMADSVKAVGIQTPAVVRLKEDGRYELVSGHRRKMASELAGLETMPCIVRQLSRDEAIISMVDSNLQREVILPSEKARSYKMKLEAMKRQSGERTDLTSAPVGQRSDGKTSREVLAENSPDSHSQIQRYIRLTELTPSILSMVDEGQLPMRPAVELSYLPQEQQQLLQDVIEAEERTPSHTQAVKMRILAKEGRLDSDAIMSIMQEDKPGQMEHFKLPREKIHRFFPVGTPAQMIEETIIKALELWHKNQALGLLRDSQACIFDGYSNRILFADIS